MSSENFNWINTFLFPYKLGFISKSNMVDDPALVVVNPGRTHFRNFGDRKWQKVEYRDVLDATAIDLEHSAQWNSASILRSIVQDEKIKNPTACFDIQHACQGFWLATWGDLQAQYHYCLTLVDPLLIENSEQVLQFLFPGSTEDLWSSLPESQTSIPSPMLAGSLGHLADLKLEETLKGIAEAKKRILKH